MIVTSQSLGDTIHLPVANWDLAVFPVEHDDEIVLVSNEGQVIR